MGKLSFYAMFKVFIRGIAWNVVIWGAGLTEEEYWEGIYNQEKAHREDDEGEAE